MSRRSLAWWSTRSLPVLAIALLAACGTSGGDATPPPGTTPDADGGTLPDGAPIVTPPGPDASTDAEAGPRDYVDMKISASATDALNPTQNPLVISQSTQVDSGGTTSLRFSSTKPIDDNMFPVGAPNNNQVADPSQRKVEQRDRDLGQSFLTGAQGFAIDSVHLRVGFSDQAVLPGALGANVALQLFEIKGYPSNNESGTPGFAKNRDGSPKFDRATSPQLDDYLQGETYVPILLAKGTLPAVMNKGDYLTFTLAAEGHLQLKPHQGYAFLLLFTDRAPDRSIGLANAYFGNYRPDNVNGLVGHGIRREGGSGDPSVPHFKPDLPDVFTMRIAQQPGTLGFPDVDTWRDLYFAVAAVAGTLK